MHVFLPASEPPSTFITVPMAFHRFYHFYAILSQIKKAYNSFEPMQIYIYVNIPVQGALENCYII